MTAYTEKICATCAHYGSRLPGTPLGFCKLTRTETERERDGCPKWKSKREEWRNG